jgi:pSer/pThr/pTyr-binding forkhead associated (FHA) protein
MLSWRIGKPKNQLSCYPFPCIQIGVFLGIAAKSLLEAWKPFTGERGKFMKISLVVLTPGKLQGQSIPINLSQFLIGRDPQCNLRPASALISKRHCALLARSEKVYLRDFGSTNGTFLNDHPIKDEVELKEGDKIKVGPLEFQVKIEGTPAINRPTPPPPTKKPAETHDEDSAANLLLSLGDDSSSSDGAKNEVPEGSTVMDIVAMTEGETKTPEKKDGKAEAKKALEANTSVAAKAILEKYMKRPRSQ